MGSDVVGSSGSSFVGFVGVSSFVGSSLAVDSRVVRVRVDLDWERWRRLPLVDRREESERLGTRLLPRDRDRRCSRSPRRCEIREEALE